MSPRIHVMPLLGVFKDTPPESNVTPFPESYEKTKSETLENWSVPHEKQTS
jgi:hypothetical protein